MRKTTLATALGLALGGASLTAQAALTSNAVLMFTSGVGSCQAGGTYPNCSYAGSTVTAGSWFSMDTNANGHDPSERIPMTNSGTGTASDKGFGIAIHTTFDNTGNPMNSHAGLINGTENPRFDIWNFFGNTGMDFLTSPMNDLGTDGNGNHRIDMSGWNVTWNGIPGIPMGGDTANFTADTGIGVMSCSTVTCSASSTFSLLLDSHVPTSDPSGNGNTPYRLNLTGTVGVQAAVPVPAAAWLFGSGLLGLVDVARRKQKS